MQSLRKYLLNNNLEKIRKEGIRFEKWKNFLAQKKKRDENLIISICGTESTGKTSLASFLSGILIPDMFLSTDFVRKQLEVLINSDIKNIFDTSPFLKTERQMAQKVLEKSVLQKATEAEKLYKKEEIEFLQKISQREGFSLLKNNLHLLGISLGVVTSKIFKDILFSKKKRIFILEGIHMFSFPYFFKHFAKLWREKKKPQVIEIKTQNNHLGVLPLYLAARNKEELKASYILKREKFRKDPASLREKMKRAEFLWSLNKEIEKNALRKKANIIWIDEKETPKTLSDLLKTIEKAFIC